MRACSSAHAWLALLSLLSLCITQTHGQCATLELDFCKNWNGLSVRDEFVPLFRQADLAEATKWCSDPLPALQECVPPSAIAYSCGLAIGSIFDGISGDNCDSYRTPGERRRPPDEIGLRQGLCYSACTALESLQRDPTCAILNTVNGTSSTTYTSPVPGTIAPINYILPFPVDCNGLPTAECITGDIIVCPTGRPYIFVPRPPTPTPDLFDPDKDDFEGRGSEEELPWYRSQLQGSYVVAGVIFAMTITVIGCCIYRNKTKSSRAAKRAAKEEAKRLAKEQEEYERAAAFRAQEQFWAMSVSTTQTMNGQGQTFDADFTNAIGGRFDEQMDDDVDRGVVGNILHEVTHFFDEDHHQKMTAKELRSHRQRLNQQRDEVRDAKAAHAAATAFYKAKNEKEAMGLELTEEDIIKLQEEISKEQGLVMRDPEEKSEAIRKAKEAKAEKARKRGDKDCAIL